MGRFCAQCSRDLPRWLFTNNQIKKGEGNSTCIEGVGSEQSGAGRAGFSIKHLERRLAWEKFRRIAKGRHVSGVHKGQAASWSSNNLGRSPSKS